MVLTPCDIEVLLHYYVSPYELEIPHIEHPRLNASAVKASIEMFINSGLMVKRDDQLAYGSSYSVTEKGDAFIEMLGATPFPVQIFTDPRKLKDDF